MGEEHTFFFEVSTKILAQIGIFLACPKAQNVGCGVSFLDRGVGESSLNGVVQQWQQSSGISHIFDQPRDIFPWRSPQAFSPFPS